MASGGPPPKGIGNRRRYGQATKGEWVELEPLSAPILEPAMPGWPAESRRIWEAIRNDPISSQYSEADVQLLKETMRVWRKLDPNQQQRRIEAFGVTPKGRRDLRWRTQLEKRQQDDVLEEGHRLRRLRVTAEREAAKSEEAA